MLPVFRLAALGLLASLPARGQLTLAAAANARPALDEVRGGFTRATGIATQAIYGASGKLAAQIRNGAPFDLFLSADTAFPESLAAWGKASGRPRVYAYGKLVLWTLKDLDPGQGLSLLAQPTVRKVAVADPERAPYGREAVKALERAGVYGAVKDKLVFGESIGQVNQYVALGTVDIGITARSAVLVPETRNEGRWAAVDSSAYDPIAQAAVATAYGAGRHAAETGRFLEYLASPPARAALAAYGYGLP